MAAQNKTVQTSSLATAESERIAGRTSGRSAGDFADKTYFIDPDGKVSSSQPERGSVLVAEGDVITDAIAASLKGAR